MLSERPHQPCVEKTVVALTDRRRVGNTVVKDLGELSKNDDKYPLTSIWTFVTIEDDLTTAINKVRWAVYRSSQS